METKAHIRTCGLMRRDAMSLTEREYASKIILSKMITRIEYKEARKLLIYVSFRTEVATITLVEKALEDKKEVYCPKVKGRDIVFYQITCISQLQQSRMGILEPDESAEVFFAEADENVLVVMPGTVFDKERNRIGYGGGFYDRFLNQYPHLVTIGLFFSCQEWGTIPAEAFDYKPNIIITEHAVFS